MRSAKLEAALNYASRGWHVLPLHWITSKGKCSCGKADCESPGKHPRGDLAPNGYKDATADIATIETWWHRYPNANIGIATGASGLTVLDVDGPEGRAELDALGATLPATYTVRTGRKGGWHFYYKGSTCPSSQVRGQHLDVRGTTGYVVAPPSNHSSGQDYAVARDELPKPCPAWIEPWVRGRSGSGIIPAEREDSRPEHIRRLALPRLADTPEPWTAAAEARLRAALAWIPANIDGKTWVSYLGAIYDLRWPCGLDIGDDWSKRSEGKGAGNGEYKGRNDIEKRWKAFENKKYKGPRVTVGSIFADATARGWDGTIPEEKSGQSDPADESRTNGHAYPVNDLFDAEYEPNALKALRDLDNKFFVIGDVGGKCKIMSRVASKLDRNVKVPLFQDFKSFGERFANHFVKVKKTDGNGEITEKNECVAKVFITWNKRKTYEGIDLEPNPDDLPKGFLNLWDGFGVAAKSGSWALMKRHIVEVLAAGDREAALYIMRHAAWCVQNPGERAEVALVFRGGKGSGKGSFASALAQIFGGHGLQIFNPKHLVGAFNAHLRNCLLLFADEAFWAGDKQGESTLKGLITEKALVIEQKGVDAVAWRNRLKLIMAANADWVVPASHDERRYAMFNVSEHRTRDTRYFEALHAEMRGGGLGAMLHDLLAVNLKGWHPRAIVQTRALQQQKIESMSELDAWMERLLQIGHLPFHWGKHQTQGLSSAIMEHYRAAGSGKPLSSYTMAKYLDRVGCTSRHTDKGALWEFPSLEKMRKAWVERWGNWEWRISACEWINRNELEKAQSD